MRPCFSWYGLFGGCLCLFLFVVLFFFATSLFQGPSLPDPGCLMSPLQATQVPFGAAKTRLGCELRKAVMRGEAS